LVFGSGGYPKKETVAINAKNGQVIWRNLDKSYEQSMLATGGYLYTLNDNGIAICWRASDGQEMWKERLGGPVSASPLLVGENIIASNEKGEFFVFKANPQKLEILHRTQMGNESFASPAISGNRMFLRVASGQGRGRQETVYCIGGS
jgi:outer membrane protein assembly factor BamB